MNGIEHAIEQVEAGLRQFPDGALRPILISLLGLTLVWSGIAKARAPWSAAFAISDFGVTRGPSVRLAWAVAIAELALAVLLLTAPAISSDAILLACGVATVLFLVFFALIARSLIAGQSFACACFGGREELGLRSLARSGALAVIAAACTVAGPIGHSLSVEELSLTWSAAAGLIGTAVLLMHSREVARLPWPLTGRP